MDDQLSALELEALQLYADGLQSPQIATALNHSAGYIKNVGQRLKQKLGADTIAQACCMGLRRGLIK